MSRMEHYVERTSPFNLSLFNDVIKRLRFTSHAMDTYTQVPKARLKVEKRIIYILHYWEGNLAKERSGAG